MGCCGIPGPMQQAILGSPCAWHAARAGAEKVHDLGELSEYEQAGLKALIPELKSSIDKGIEFGQSG